MPDIIDVLAKRWKLVLALTFVATLLALIVSLLRPKEYRSTVTALPANSATLDKARIFNSNIEGLYPEIGSPDELDRIEGTAKLDTVYLSVAGKLGLASHYGLGNEPNAVFRAAMVLKKKTDIRRSAYGELKINVWDGSPALAAQLANALLQELNGVHRHVQNVNNLQILQLLKENVQRMQRESDSLAADLVNYRGSQPNLEADQPPALFAPIGRRMQAVQNQLKEYEEMIGRYELATATTAQPLIAVENARPALSPDRPNVLQTTVFAFGASLLFSFLLAFYAESRRQKA